MKLITKTTLLYMLITALVISASGWVLYQIANTFLENQTQAYFTYRESRILSRLSEPVPDLKLLNSFRSQRVVPVTSVKIPTQSKLERDTMLLNDMSGDIEPFRARTFDAEVNGKVYRINIFVGMQESVLLNKFIIQSAFYIFLALIAVLLLLNYLSSRFLWRPFDHTLEQMKHYSINQNQPLVLLPTTTQEFKDLNRLLSQTIARIEHDYRNIKEFTENISHEVQTPLAVIKAKVEMLLKTDNISSGQLKALNAVYQSTSRLSKLSKTLGLISKIDNQEFTNKEQIMLKPFIQNILYNFEELAELKNVKICADLDEKASMYIDGYLLDVLLSNLLKNALSHNFANGEITVRLQSHRLSIINTGQPLNFPVEQLFDRFRKNPDKPQSLGLGLAIVKKICDMNNLAINYHYEQERHIFDLSF
ncbi:MAG: hypothetical protein COW65_19115 [Cytophagales bacterium CG18_big_fil_WC_8_21_14_2_50_42_9]|nr:MAG: hypothetical protein COW65_19115 [Cytophagales bacterium CG18_big_fil_WC_8_21_14_2_50_42_9]